MTEGRSLVIASEHQAHTVLINYQRKGKKKKEENRRRREKGKNNQKQNQY